MSTGTCRRAGCYSPADPYGDYCSHWCMLSGTGKVSAAEFSGRQAVKPTAEVKECANTGCSRSIDVLRVNCDPCYKLWHQRVYFNESSEPQPQTKTKTKSAESVAHKDGKVPMELIDLDFIHDVAKQFLGGLVNGRKPDGWKELDPAVYRAKCYGAALRHMRLARRGRRELDSATGATHLAAVVANMMMVWWFEGP